MSKHILGTHQGKPLTPSIVSFLEQKGYSILQTESWAEAIKMCSNVTFDLIIGHCNYDHREIAQYILNNNENYNRKDKTPASIILQAKGDQLNSKYFAKVNIYIKEIIPYTITESSVISLIEKHCTESHETGNLAVDGGQSSANPSSRL